MGTIAAPHAEAARTCTCAWPGTRTRRMRTHRYYFGADSGDKVGVLFQNSLSGLTHHERTADGFEYISAYRFHTSDPLVMSDGGRSARAASVPPTLHVLPPYHGTT